MDPVIVGLIGIGSCGIICGHAGRFAMALVGFAGFNYWLPPLPASATARDVLPTVVLFADGYTDSLLMGSIAFATVTADYAASRPLWAGARRFGNGNYPGMRRFCCHLRFTPPPQLLLWVSWK